MRRAAFAFVAVLAFLLPQGLMGQAVALTNADVITLVAAGVQDQTTIAAIEQARQRQFDISTAAVAVMKQAGVSDAVINAMQSVSSPLGTATGVVGQASSLVGLTQAQVQAKIGLASGFATDVWYFDSPAGRLRLSFKNGVVSEARPNDFLLSGIPGPEDTTSQPTTTSTSSPASSAGIVCRDGSVSDAANRQGACSSHGGIATASTTTTKKKK